MSITASDRIDTAAVESAAVELDVSATVHRGSAATSTAQIEPAPVPGRWRSLLRPYERPTTAKSAFGVAITLGPLVGAYVLLKLLPLSWSFALIPVFMVFLARTFILMHDCCHGSLFRSRRANSIVGFVTGVMTLTSFGQWRRDHAVHHANSGRLEGRGVGDVATMTLQEYLRAGRWSRFMYRIYRHPATLLGLGPLWLVLCQRWHTPRTASRREVLHVHITNAVIVLMFIGLIAWIGLLKLAVVVLPAALVTGAAGVWMFYVQHQYERTYWATRQEWDYQASALDGSSCYRLPKLLEWITGNIGYHHVHHLSPRVPHYNLRRCHEEVPPLRAVRVLTWRESVRAFSLKLWDEERKVLVGWSALRQPIRVRS